MAVLSEKLTVFVNTQQLHLLIAGGESYSVEFKAAVSADLAREMVAFANARGGKLLVGVHDDGSIAASPCSNSVKSKVQDIARNCEPPLRVHLSQVDGVLVVDVPEGRDKPYQCRSGFYTRIGPNAQKLKRDEIVRMIQHSGYIRWEEQPYRDYPFEQVYDRDLLQNFLRLQGKVQQLPQDLPEEQLLMGFKCAMTDGEHLYLTNAGFLFFGRLPDYVMAANAGITCALFKGLVRRNLLDRKDFQRDIISNIESAMSFLKQHLRLRYEVPSGSLRRRDVPEIPYDALREALVNASIHREYSLTGIPVQVDIYDDRVDIYNLGGLPPELSPQDFGMRSAPRNPVIADMMYKVEYMERMGTGIRKMRDLCREAEIALPHFVYDHDFRVSFHREVLPNNLHVGESPVQYGATTRELPKSYPKRSPDTLDARYSGGEPLPKSYPKRSPDTLDARHSGGGPLPKSYPKRPPGIPVSNRQRIVEVLLASPTATRVQIAEILGDITADGVKYHLQKMRQSGILERIGGRKGGYWKLNL